MSIVFHEWAQIWGVPPVAIADLFARLTVVGHSEEDDGRSEAAIQAEIRLAAAKRGDMVLWRNNSGALPDQAGRLIRFGLGNDSAQANKRMKSADLIGVHKPSGRFVSIEVKKPGWKHSDSSERDGAQAAWAATISAFGGIALRVTSAQTITDLEI